ncbi:MAG: hypothetical protein F6K10_12490 [Moorea sp. SIO2B7]|nr:hypothetical protein [Moorena sp. SIO2B7]
MLPTSKSLSKSTILLLVGIIAILGCQSAIYSNETIDINDPRFGTNPELSELNPQQTKEILAELEKNRRKWHSHKIKSYQYLSTMMCFCAPPANITIKVLVRKNVVTSVTNAETNQPISNPNLESYKSIDELFEVIEKAVKKGAAQILVDYDSQFGYPSRINIDYIKMAADDEITFLATDLVIR